MLSGAIKKDSDNGADKMARQLNKCATSMSKSLPCHHAIVDEFICHLL